MNDDLILVCVMCDDTTAPRPYAPWPRHCGMPMRLANTTDRDGNLIEQAKAIHPANGPEAE